MNIHESAEDYLEKILMLQEQKGSVRSIDIAVAMGYSKPSVSVAMKNLRENGYISMDSDGFIKLEAPGMEIANRIYGRHRKLTAFFIALSEQSLLKPPWASTPTPPPRTPAKSSMT